jgi:hypothetical protein
LNEQQDFGADWVYANGASTEYARESWVLRSFHRRYVKHLHHAASEGVDIGIYFWRRTVIDCFILELFYKLKAGDDEASLPVVPEL